MRCYAAQAIGEVSSERMIGGMAGGERTGSTSALLQVRSSVFAGGFNPADCAGTAPVSASGNNLDSDGSCAGFSGNVNFAANFNGPALLIEDGRAVLRPRAGAPVIDAASDCLDLDGVTVDIDQGGRARPLDGNGDLQPQCDIGAIEFSFEIFRDGFEASP